MTEPNNLHHLDGRRRRDVDDVAVELVDVESIAGQLRTLRDLGVAIAARSTVLLIPDPELVFAGQRVEHIATHLFRQIFAPDLPR